MIRPPPSTADDPQIHAPEAALADADALLFSAENFAVMLAELAPIALPPATHADPMQLRAIASLYLAAALESAGLIEAADDLVRMIRTGMVSGDLGAAAEAVQDFWRERRDHIQPQERQSLFARLFGTPSDALDMVAGSNTEFDEKMLDLCDAIIKAAEQGATRKLHVTVTRLAENIGAAANDALLLMAREIIDMLSQAIAILNHPAIRAMLGARTLWDAVASIDRRLRRPPRGTLNHLRRGRAGMAVIAWVADVLTEVERDGTAALMPPDVIVTAALDWIDETVALLRQEEANAAQPQDPGAYPRGQPAWADLAH
ncbi:MAG: hypothetical protein U0S50_10875 [Sphingopyxis sp.]|uniref:hypothetical protein n=1 Tax=Sphingopyxis sp. TaxID=1908224 RepID=UPI002ABBD862|nr:hypothetical protein [Sphingopyxis sp.]MDZ3832309.1 hypothetical protein [Sphingopyxis sp.]